MKTKISTEKDRDKILKNLFYNYSNGKRKLPAPTFIDALFQSNKNNMKKEITRIFRTYKRQISNIEKESKIPIDLPNEIISFIFPLDFYIPIYSPYHAMSTKIKRNTISEFNSATIISDTVRVGKTKVKVSTIILSVCNKDNKNKKFDYNHLYYLFNETISEVNRVISSYQAIPTRHNHYMHYFTNLSCSGNIKFYIFNRKNGKILKKDNIEIHNLIFGEVFQSRPLDDMELNHFRINHINSISSNDKVYSLISKFNEAINYRCLGYDSEAIIFADSFFELSLGYLFCEATIETGKIKKDVLKEYSEFQNLSDLFTSLSNIIGISNTKFKKSINNDAVIKYCRNLRNDLTHRFMDIHITAEESLNAIFYVGDSIYRLCELLQKRFPDNNFHFLYSKLELLKNSTIFAKDLHSLKNNQFPE